MIRHIINSHHSILATTSPGQDDACHHVDYLLDLAPLSFLEIIEACRRVLPIITPLLLDQGSDYEYYS